MFIYFPDQQEPGKGFINLTHPLGSPGSQKLDIGEYTDLDLCWKWMNLKLMKIWTMVDFLNSLNNAISITKFQKALKKKEEKTIEK